MPDVVPVMTPRLIPAALAVLALALVGCGSEEGPDSARDPAAGSDETPAPPTAVPAAPGRVHTAFPATVMDTGQGAELCLGGVAESYPPQCSGPAIPNWTWAEFGQDMYDEQGEVRWGLFAVTGTWDGSEFTVESAVPGPLYDPAQSTPPPLADPAVDLDEDELVEISDGLNDVIPGYLTSYADGGHVLASVIYDDGTLQDYVDARYGRDVVVIQRMLVDLD